jgi:tryptophan-rich sensory protein
MTPQRFSNRTQSLGRFALASTLVGLVALSGIHFRPGPWYEMLSKPVWTPPNWVFPLVWSLLYIMIAIVGGILLKGHDRLALRLWLTQLIMNALWSWLFFGLHRTGWALLDLLAMTGCIVVLMVLSLKRERIVAMLLGPYLLWVLYALSLNAGIFWLN